MSNKEKILDLYYNEHLKQNQIAKLLDVTAQYVSKVVKADNRIKQEKATRQKENSQRRKVYMHEYFKTYDRPKKDDNSYEQMLAQQRLDSMELSYSNTNISDYDFAKWNQSAYYRNSKGKLSLVKGLKVGSDVPRTINMNIKVPTQKYKNKYVYSY